MNGLSTVSVWYRYGFSFSMVWFQFLYKEWFKYGMSMISVRFQFGIGLCRFGNEVNSILRVNVFESNSIFNLGKC
jgi:hypothetical protein